MRILHLISQRPDSTGSGIYVRQLIDSSVQSGHDNRLVAGIQRGQLPVIPAMPGDHCSFVTFQSEELPLPIVGMSDVMPYPSARFRDLSRMDIALYERSFAGTIASVVAAFQPHIIHSHHLWLLSSLTARLFPRIPLVATCHGSDLRQFRNCPHLQSRVQSGCRQIPAIMALSEPQKLEIARLYRIPAEKITVVGGGYCSSLFYQEKKALPAPVRLLYAGKLSEAKGVVWLLRALAALNSEYHLDLIGSGAGSEHERCRDLAERFAGTVTLHGALPQDRLASLMRRAHIMVLPSLYEGLPLIMLEAIAAGCRVIATDLPGTWEIAKRLNTSYITLVPCPRLQQVDKILPEDEPLFTAGLLQALENVCREVSREPDLDLAPLQELIHYYSWAQVYSRTEAVYRQTLAAAGSASAAFSY